ncbi:methyl-accepting chemotaxis protein [Aliarcobacter butzleri]|nr:methyl-accepting chemotaxis protein [Aliarcobacter butzleri]MCT7615276.1 methyl-accepting chemotaxis protein [Aliarcobacter butzleri]
MFFNSNENILEILKNIEAFLKNDINSLPYLDIKDKKIDSQVKDLLYSICEILNVRNNEELQIYGELMLVSEKIGNGLIGDNIYHINTSNVKLNYIARTINSLVDSLNNTIRQVTSILNEYSKYNYLNKLDLKYVSNDFKNLFEGINTLRENITEMLKEDKINGLTLDKSSNILLENVDKLNLSSTQAASSLEQTAATLEEMTGNIKANTENISKMAILANEVNLSAQEGENLANKTMVSMDEINNQVIAINEAILVIDNIAFQTNILSLNAAVEAATAGEAGKGFAVVAQEVRNLATRSAQAAKEIKELVENATKKANEGKNITSDMIRGYKKLNNSIVQTVNIIKDVEFASKEQLFGIEQINNAINILDTQTQENALIAAQAHEIALLTDKISKKIVSSVNIKEFEGKNQIKPLN